MKSMIKKVTPTPLINLLRKLINKVLIRRAYKLDLFRFSKSAFNVSIIEKLNQENLEAKITKLYHSLEKGLSNINFRHGFGERAYIPLIDSMDKYIEKNYDISSTSFQTGLSVLNAYVLKHSHSDYDTSYIQKKINSLRNSHEISDIGGVFELKKNEIINNSKIDFKNLVLRRHSVRDFSKDSVDLDLIYEALEIAKRTPSVCNRQPWHTHIIINKLLIEEILSIQGGFTGYGSNLKTLILITSNNNYLSDYTERNQGFIDSGMYSMSLIYSLEYLDLASCPLNADLSINKDKKIRKLLDIPENQNLIMFIAVGKYKNIFKVPKSQRESVYKKSTLHK